MLSIYILYNSLKKNRENKLSLVLTAVLAVCHGPGGSCVATWVVLATGGVEEAAQRAGGSSGMAHAEKRREQAFACSRRPSRAVGVYWGSCGISRLVFGAGGLMKEEAEAGGAGGRSHAQRSDENELSLVLAAVLAVCTAPGGSFGTSWVVLATRGVEAAAEEAGGAGGRSRAKNTTRTSFRSFSPSFSRCMRVLGGPAEPPGSFSVQAGRRWRRQRRAAAAGGTRAEKRRKRALARFRRRSRVVCGSWGVHCGLLGRFLGGWDGGGGAGGGRRRVEPTSAEKQRKRAKARFRRRPRAVCGSWEVHCGLLGRF